MRRRGCSALGAAAASAMRSARHRPARAQAELLLLRALRVPPSRSLSVAVAPTSSTPRWLSGGEAARLQAPMDAGAAPRRRMRGAARAARCQPTGR